LSPVDVVQVDGNDLAGARSVSGDQDKHISAYECRYKFRAPIVCEINAILSSSKECERVEGGEFSLSR
jgi:hypothetical protein